MMNLVSLCSNHEPKVTIGYQPLSLHALSLHDNLEHSSHPRNELEKLLAVSPPVFFRDVWDKHEVCISLM